MKRWTTALLSALILAACGTNSDVPLAADGGGYGDFGDGGVDCTNGPNFTGCPCQQGETRACYTGPGGTEGVGPCKGGTQTCEGATEVVAGGFGPCVGEVVPSAGVSCTSTTADAGLAADAGRVADAGSQTDAASDGEASDAAVGCSQLSCQPQVLATGQRDAVDVVVDATNVYYASSDGVRTVHKDGTGLVTMAAIVGAAAVAVDSVNVYWTTAVNGTGSLVGMSKTGGVQTTLWSSGSELGNFVATDGTSIYWTVGTLTSGGPMSVLPNGTGLTTLTPSLTAPRGMALDSNVVYFASSDTVYRVGKDGSGLQGIAYGQADVWNVATFQGAVFWSVFSSNGSALRTLQGSNVVELYAYAEDGGPAFQVRGIAADATGVYFALYGMGAGSVQRVQADGTGLAAVAASEFGPAGVALDDTYVYWSTADAIKRLPKCCVH